MDDSVGGRGERACQGEEEGSAKYRRKQKFVRVLYDDRDHPDLPDHRSIAAPFFFTCCRLGAL